MTAPAPVWWAYAILVVAVVSMSSGGVWFALLPETPPLMQACWRLQLTVALQAVGFAHEWRHHPTLQDPAFWARFCRNIPLLVTIGLALGVHFGSWGWSVAHTSLLDSLLLVSSTPLLLVVIMAMRWAYRWMVGGTPSNVVRVCLPLSESKPAVVITEAHALLPADAPSDPSWFRTVICPFPALPPTPLEVLGAVVGFSGVVLLLATSSQQHNAHQVTLAGNAAAMLGALAILVYLEGGAGCRKWMPLFAYALPVTAIATVELAVASLVFEPTTSIVGVGSTALWGFLGDTRRFGLAFGAAAVSGMLGHTCANLAVKYVSPLLISVAVLWEPLLGGFMGYLVGVQGPPDVSAIVAAPLLLGGAFLVTLGARKTGLDHIVLTKQCDTEDELDDHRGLF
ncbi:hypothetical protein H310_12413 [Aphanomyces invadans]|uniref:EamA domain-containing protein n=1 Tax=Aphanomyces invadans TaxID=157072 RepID=A0A024TJU4_9STRA|nr:hypothetical protein H310_12413 [Aphanomyces invadans]ETV93632.1 hypothetical protein H310_12413 [Aphanomyces invadans]|eukprot:XP_008877673.1 hypothetical protein H310_12413 [Aphanomyces invadans]